MMTIYNKTGVEIPDLDTSHAGVSYSADLGNSNLGTFEVSFYSANAVTIPAHSYTDPNDSDDPTDWYYLLDAIAPTDTDKGYHYALTFEHFSKLFQQIEFYYEDATETRQYSWTLSAKLDTAAGLILSAIQREFPTFGVTLGGYLSSTESKDLEFDGLNVYEAATYIAATFETEFWFYGAEMHFEEAIFGESLPHELTHSVNIEDSITAEYGDLRPQYVRALGGVTNMPVSTEGAIAYQGRLPMPDGKEVIEIEGVETGVTLNLKLDNYFPSMGGEITEVEYNGDDENPIYYVKTDLGYTLDSVKIDNGTVRVMYFTGGISAQLTGREFDAEDYVDDQIQIFRTEDNGKFIPRPNIAPAVGDTFLLKNVTVNDTEITEAQEELEAYVDDYVETLKTKSPNITLTTASVYYANNPHMFRIGESVKVTHPSILGGSTTSRCVAISIADWAEPSKVALTIQDEISAGRVSTLESGLQDLTANVNSTVTSSNVTYDTRYIRKDVDDTVAGNLVFERGLRSNNFDASIRSGFNLFKDENGRGILQLNKIEANELSVDIYTYNQITAVGGAIVVSRAWAEVSRIASTDNETPTYTFYYRPKDGVQLWKVGHQPRMASGGRYYWGLITQVSAEVNADGEHWFTCNSSSELYVGDPANVAVGDTFVLFGSRGEDALDRNVTIIDSGSADNPYPSLSQYFDIDSFDLSNVGDKTSAKISRNTTIGVDGAQIVTDVDNSAIYLLGNNIFFRPSGSTTSTALIPTIVSTTESITAIESDGIFSINEKLAMRTEWEAISGLANVTHTPEEAVSDGTTGSYSIAVTSAAALGGDTTTEVVDTFASIVKTDTGSSDDLYWSQDGDSYTSPNWLDSSEDGDKYSYMRLTFNANVETEVSIAWVVSSEENFDHLVIGAVDQDNEDSSWDGSNTDSSIGTTGDGLDYASGENSGTTTRTIPAGEHFIDVWYTKDESYDVGYDRVSITLSYDSSGSIETTTPKVDTTALTSAYQALLDLFAEDALNLYGEENTTFTRSDLSDTLSAYYNAESAVVSATTETKAIVSIEGDLYVDGLINSDKINTNTLIAKKLLTSESGERVEVTGNALYVFDGDNELGVTLTGQNFESSDEVIMPSSEGLVEIENEECTYSYTSALSAGGNMYLHGSYDVATIVIPSTEGVVVTIPSLQISATSADSSKTIGEIPFGIKYTDTNGNTTYTSMAPIMLPDSYNQSVEIQLTKAGTYTIYFALNVRVSGVGNYLSVGISPANSGEYITYDTLARRIVVSPNIIGLVGGRSDKYAILSAIDDEIVISARDGRYHLPMSDYFVTSDGLSGYCKYSDGRLEQWGYHSGSPTSGTLYFDDAAPFLFDSDVAGGGISIFGGLTMITSGYTRSVFFLPTSATTFSYLGRYAGASNAGTGAGPFFWRAYGRWKL